MGSVSFQVWVRVGCELSSCGFGRARVQLLFTMLYHARDVVWYVRQKITI